MAIIFYCYRCGQKGEFETKKEMRCDCGHYVKKRNNIKDHVNMRNTWSGTTKVEFSETTIEKDIAERNAR
tara:strand:- start:1894 stop:2103 length:210 start_codon:yes stop_codon:yes gene_type:complete